MHSFFIWPLTILVLQQTLQAKMVISRVIMNESMEIGITIGRIVAIL